MALIKTGQDNESPVRIVETVVAVNDQRKRAMARKVANAFGGNLRGKSIAVLGVTFKPNTDDMRDAPSIPLITALQDMGAEVRVFDPVGMEQAKKVFENVTFCENAYHCAKGCSRARHRHGMGTVSGTGSQGIVGHHGLPGHRRSAQHLLSGRGGTERLFVLRRGPAEIVGVLMRRGRHDIGWLRERA